MDIFLNLIIVAALILLNAFFVLAEFALVKVRQTKLEELARKGNSKAKLAQRVSQKLDNYLATIQLGITMASLGLGWVGEPTVAKLIHIVFPYISPVPMELSHVFSFGLAFIIVTSLHVVLGEQVPKLIAIKSPAALSMWTSPPLVVFYVLTYLPMRMLTETSSFVLKMIGFHPDTQASSLSDEEMKMVLAQSQEQGKLSLGRLLMFENLFDFGAVTVKEIMTPIDSVAYLSLEKSWAENTEIIKKRRFSRYPLCKKDLSDTIGYIVLKDITIEMLSGNMQPQLDAKKREILTIPEDTLAERALREFQEKRLHQAIVKDKDGKVKGLLTLEDVLEELIGEIRDEIEPAPSALLSRVLVPDATLMDIQNDEKFEAMRSLLQSLHKASPVFNFEETWELVKKREEMISCALGNETAFPHARINSISRPIIAFGKSSKGINFPSPDKKPVKLIFLILTPYNDPSYQLRILSRLAGLISNRTLKNKLINAKTPQEAAEVLRAFENKIAV